MLECRPPSVTVHLGTCTLCKREDAFQPRKASVAPGGQGVARSADVCYHSLQLGCQEAEGQNLSSSLHSKSTACSSMLRTLLGTGCNLKDLMGSWKSKLLRQCEQLTGERERKTIKKKREKWRQ